MPPVAAAAAALAPAATVAAGVDVGSVSSKVAIMCDGELCAYSVIRTGADSNASAQKAMDRALQAAGMEMGNIKHKGVEEMAKRIVVEYRPSLTLGYHFIIIGVD